MRLENDLDYKMSLAKKIYEIIFEADTKAGKIFDIGLLLIIISSIIIIMLESVDYINNRYSYYLLILEWIITILFSIEYFLRIIVVKKPLRYIFSFYGIIDLLAILPSYLSLFLPIGHSIIVIRSLRLLRVFRILRLTKYSKEAELISKALLRSKAKILVFLFAIITLVIILGTMMFLIEGKQNGFTNIPKSIYWAIVTLTTVGYGDISPVTPLGQFISSLVMIIGYAIIAVPTGIISVEFSRSSKSELNNTQVCPNCMNDMHNEHAIYCHRCGNLLN